jgi:hypothetical protein
MAHALQDTDSFAHRLLILKLGLAKRDRGLELSEHIRGLNHAPLCLNTICEPIQIELNLLQKALDPRFVVPLGPDADSAGRAARCTGLNTGSECQLG